jgi:hypothetical protein
MWETCAVDLRVHLPKTVAVEVEQVQRNDPEMLSRILFYAMTRRTIYDTLAAKAATDGTKGVLTPQIP